MKHRTSFFSLAWFVAGSFAVATTTGCGSSNNAQGDGSIDGSVRDADDAGDAGDTGSSDDGATLDATGSDAARDAGSDASNDVASPDAADADADADAGPPVWRTPQCGAAVDSQGAVTFTLDEGSSLAPIDRRATGISYTFALAALDTPNNLVAEHQGKVLRSQDAGCTWVQIGTVDNYPLTMMAAPGGRAYAFQDNGAGFYRIEGDTITTLRGPAPNVVGIGVDHLDGMHLRAGDTDGHLWESLDAGATWSPIGVQVPIGSAPTLMYRYAFDPNNLDHALVGVSQLGAFQTEDGGATWTSVTGLADHLVNVFSIVISPVDSNVVWMQGIDLDHSDEPVWEGRKIWRSGDRGLTATEVVRQSETVTIRNQELLAAHPTEPAVLYFVFGTYFNNYGTDIYRYDFLSGQIKTTHNPYNDVNAVAFSPVDATVMYLGLTWDAQF